MTLQTVVAHASIAPPTFAGLAALLEPATAPPPLATVTAVEVLWSATLADLIRPDCDLPIETRAHLIGLGVRLLMATAALRHGRCSSTADLHRLVVSITEAGLP
jgi:flagellar biosynthesis regulator FlaF